MNIHILRITLEGNKMKKREIPRLRGYIASKFPQYLELHNHIGENSYNYGYPMVQYKTFNGVPGVIAINDASNVLIQAFQEIDEIDLKEEVLDIMEKGYSVKKCAFGIIEEMRLYSFISPWMALNRKNYEQYKNSKEDKKSRLLKKILIGNILSMSKYLNYTVSDQINILIKLKPIEVNFKNQQMIGFTGEFMVNFEIPDYLGLGKSVSRGFGTIKRVKEGVFR